MADKPKTYAMQVQELKQQLEDAITDREGALRQASFVPELQDEISQLNAKLTDCNESHQRFTVTDKAKLTDLMQRAESAEQGNRNAQMAYQRLKEESQGLQQQIDILGLERDKNRGKDDKINLLHEELKAANLRVASLQQQLRDAQQIHNEGSARQEKEVIYLRQLAKAQSDLLQNLTGHIEALPLEALSELKRLSGNG